MRLIDADALSIALLNNGTVEVRDGGGLSEMVYYTDMLDLITNAPTVQREGWVRVEELQKVYDDMFKHKDIAISANSLFKLIQAAPTDTE